MTESIGSSEPPFETAELRNGIRSFLTQQIVDPITGQTAVLGNFRFGVYAFYDYDGEPIYVGQTNEQLRTRIRRHLTNQRTDAVAMNVLDPFEVRTIEVWPLTMYGNEDSQSFVAEHHLDWLEYEIFLMCIDKSRFKAILNEKDPTDVSNRLLPSGLRIADSGFSIPPSWRGNVVSDSVFQLRNHPDTRIARRAATLAMLAKVISERQVQSGLRRTMATQALRLSWLAQRRLEELRPIEEQADAID